MILNPLPDGDAYWAAIRGKARELGSDGCTGSMLGSLHIETCYEHDIHYRTRAWLGGERITRSEADKVMRSRIQQSSPLGVFSLVAWGRWSAIQIRHAWPVAKLFSLFGKPTPWDAGGGTRP